MTHDGTGGWRRPLPDRDELRRQMRARRRALTTHERRRAASAIASILERSRWIRPGAHVAAYASIGSEADLSAAIARMHRRGCTLYLPVVTRYRPPGMRFVPWSMGSRLERNAFGIPEPSGHAAPRVAVRRLDVVLLPLLAVDDRGWRLGSGQGFYDRQLAHLRDGRRWRRPRLVGIGYEFQRVRRLEAARWDVPLDALVTERACYRYPTRGRT